MGDAMVSIIIPCYNCSEFVSRAIESVFRQTLANWELVLVDSGSTDGTLALLNQFQATYPYCIKCLSESAPGAPAARNTGLRHAVGDWIQFLDASDELMPGKIAGQLAIAGSGPFDVIAGTYLSISDSGKGTIEKVRFPAKDHVWEYLISSKLGTTSANLWKKEALLQINGWDESLGSSKEDDLLFRLLVAGSGIGFDFSLQTTVYDSEKSRLTTTDPKRLERILEDQIHLRSKIKNHLIDQGLFNQQMSAFYDACIYRLLVRRRGQIPDYVSRKLAELCLDVPLREKLRLNTSLLISQLFRRST